MVVQHNITAINANRYYGINNNKLAKSLEKLSSGYAINRAGDNAAGLAVSEKMRSQIAGINQGVKNAQDGISMIQTFEGALTETDSILQRMKVLADQSANGTYQNEVDRDAIQLEFNQLNDELNQIADTDFNGVVVLNGGQMADGLKAVDGKFDYSMKADQVAAANSEALIKAQAEAQAKIDAATKAVADAQSALNNTKVDMSNNGAASEWNTVDNNKYAQADVDAIFGTAGATTTGLSGTTVNETAAKSLTDLGATSVDITFEYDKDTDTWTAIKASALDKNGDDITIEGLDNITATTATATGATGAGGFTVDNTTVNAIFDATGAKTGDTVTLTFTATASETVAPNNIGMDADSLKGTDKVGVDSSDFTIAVDTGLTDTAMSKTAAEGLALLDKSSVKFTFDGSNEAVGKVVDENGNAVKGFTVAVTANATGGATSDNYTITYEDADGNSVVLATGTVAKEAAASTLTVTGGPITGTAAGAGVLTYDGTAWNDAGGNAVTTTGGTFAGMVKGDQISVDGTGAVTIVKKMSATTGDVTFGVAVDAFKYSEDGGLTVKAGKDTAINSENAVAAQNALNKAKAELQAAKDAYPTELPQGVSKSDAYDQATAPLTYTDHIMLQAGARTKDLVDFTFKYESQGLGDLKADLNCSARGLGTDKLSLATQEDANYAIDRIDNAINKTNMVRATFGAVQNRLEHKIDNLNVTSENLTSAESRIRDTNMAEEMMNFTKNQILAQASQSMLAQANQLPQGVLQLLG